MGFVRRLGALRGARQWGLAFVAGVIATSALPPFHVIPALWLSLALLLGLLNGCATWRTAALVGWAFGFGHYATGLWWISDAFYVDADMFGALAIPAVAALTFAMGLFYAVICALTHLIPPPQDDAAAALRISRCAARALWFASLWMMNEWMLTWFLTGFPWNPMATVWAESTTPIGIAMLQSVSVVGTFGLSLVTVTAAALFSVIGFAPRHRASWVWALTPLVVLIVIGGAGHWHLAQNPTTFVADVKMRIVQPNIPQAEKWRPGLREVHVADYVALSTDNRPADVNVVIWGESAISYLLDRDFEHRFMASAAAPANGLLITGADRAESQTRIFNSLYVIGPDGGIVTTYDKFHLVPFGEFMPFRSLLPFEKLTAGGDFSAGPGLTTLTVPGLPSFSPLICYEAIFPGHVVTDTPTKPRWLLNLTNDSWFGTATGPYQHFATARLRAIEEGLPLVRAANTGISAVVDPWGRIIARLDLDRRGILDSGLPHAANTRTLFSFLGNFLSLMCATIVGGGALGMYRRTKRSPRPVDYQNA